MSCRLLSASLLVVAFAAPAVAGDPAARITILYDNTAATRGLRAAWGFAALVEAHGRTVLFDTGGDPAVLRDNLAVLKVDASRIQAVVISHFHGDHTEGAGGLAAPKGTNVYTPHSFAPYGQTMAALHCGGAGAGGRGEVDVALRRHRHRGTDAVLLEEAVRDGCGVDRRGVGAGAPRRHAARSRGRGRLRPPRHRADAGAGQEDDRQADPRGPRRQSRGRTNDGVDLRTM